MPTVREQRIFIQRGDDWGPYELRCTPASGSLVGCVLIMTVKAALEDSDDAAIIQIRSDDPSPQITITGATTAEVELTAVQTKLLTSSWYFYDVAAVTSTGKNITCVQGRIYATGEVTQATA